MSKKAEAKKPGRPPGSENREYDYVPAEPTRCRVPGCGSTERAPYHHPTEHEIAGVDNEGKPYTHVVWRRTHCLACGQHRVDKWFENRVGARPAGSSDREKPADAVQPPKPEGLHQCARCGCAAEPTIGPVTRRPECAYCHSTELAPIPKQSLEFLFRCRRCGNVDRPLVGSDPPACTSCRSTNLAAAATEKE